jgi:phage baseplate assembly protein W
MALQISRAFKDISLSFTRNPVTDDVIVLKNEDAIKKSVINLVRTQIGERFFNKLIGSDIESSLFELNLQENVSYLETQIRVLLENFEPRISVKSIVVEAIVDSNDLNIEIIYDIVGLPFPQQNIRFILVTTRL